MPEYMGMCLRIMHGNLSRHFKQDTTRYSGYSRTDKAEHCHVDEDDRSQYSHVHTEVVQPDLVSYWTSA